MRRRHHGPDPLDRSATGACESCAATTRSAPPPSDRPPGHCRVRSDAAPGGDQSPAPPTPGDAAVSRGKSGVGSSFSWEIWCRWEIRWEIWCRFIILARKDEPTSRQEAGERCVGLSAISSLLQKGDSRVMSLGHPSYPRPKGTRNHSMAEKRGYVEIG